MPTFNTVLRAVIMVATAIVAVKGWQQYGPSAEQMKSFAGRALKVAHESWNGAQQAGESGSLTANAQGVAAPFSAVDLPAIDSGTTGALPADLTVAPAFTAPAAPPMFAQSTADEKPASAASDKMSPIQSEGGPLPALLARLQNLGASEPQLVEWGTSGQLYRFSCRAALADSPSFSRHFESVSAEPLVAVEEVVAKVEAWRTAQRDESIQR